MGVGCAVLPPHRCTLGLHWISISISIAIAIAIAIAISILTTRATPCLITGDATSCAACTQVKEEKKGGKKKTDEAYAAALEAAEAETTLLVQTPTEPLSALKFLWALLVIPVLGTPFMMVAMFPFQLHQLELDWYVRIWCNNPTIRLQHTRL